MQGFHIESEARVIANQFLNRRNLAIVEAGLSSGQGHQGVRWGPSYLLNKTTRRVFSENMWTLKRHDVIEDDDIVQRDWELLPSAYYRLYRKLQDMANDVDLNLIIGGDHSISLATIPALRARFNGLKVIWVDAHGDINTPLTSLSDNLHGMPVAALLGLFDVSGWRGWEWFRPCLTPADIVYVGVRDLDRAEAQLLEELGIPWFGMDEIDRYGMGNIIKRALQHLDPEENCPIHLSFDIDSVDPKIAKATGVRVPNGLRMSDCLRLGHGLKHTGRLVSCEVVEVNPAMVFSDNGVDQTRTIVQSLLTALLY